MWLSLQAESLNAMRERLRQDPQLQEDAARSLIAISNQMIEGETAMSFGSCIYMCGWRCPCSSRLFTLIEMLSCLGFV